MTDKEIENMTYEELKRLTDEEIENISEEELDKAYKERKIKLKQLPMQKKIDIMLKGNVGVRVDTEEISKELGRIFTELGLTGTGRTRDYSDEYRPANVICDEGWKLYGDTGLLMYVYNYCGYDDGITYTTLYDVWLNIDDDIIEPTLEELKNYKGTIK